MDLTAHKKYARMSNIPASSTLFINACACLNLLGGSIQGSIMKFDMSISDNYASFIDKATGVTVFVDSFDNYNFEVRIGGLEDSKPAGSVRAKSSEELNQKLCKLYNKFKGE